MEILNVGPLELILILLLALIILGPERMIIGARKVGKWINQLVRSPLWTSILDTSREIRELPQKLVEDTGIKDDWKEIQQSTKQIAKELNEVRDAVGGPEHIQVQPQENSIFIGSDDSQTPTSMVDNPVVMPESSDDERIAKKPKKKNIVNKDTLSKIEARVDLPPGSEETVKPKGE